MLIKLSDEISLWVRRLALYFGLYIVIISSHLLFSRFDFWHPNVDNINDLLGNLIQMEAAIIAIVISLSIVAVELAASSYSTRLIDAFISYRKNPDFWILLLIYGISIFYGIGVQLNSPSNLEGHISLAYYLGIFAFVSLIPYIWNILNLLKSSTVFKMLSQEITKQNILSAVRNETNQLIIDIEKDPIQPIIGIVRGSMMRYDYETTKDGLRAITARTSDIFKNENFEEQEEKKISEQIFTHLTRVGRLAISRDDEDSTHEVIVSINTNGLTAAEQKRTEVVWQAITSLHLIGISSADKKFEISTGQACSSLVKIGEKSVEKDLKILTKQGGWWEISYLKDIGIISAKHGLEHAIRVATSSIVVLGIAAAEHRLKNTTKMAINSIEAVGTEAAKYGLIGATQEAAESLRCMIEVTVGKEEYEDEGQKAIKSHMKIYETLRGLERKI